jgi:hypothetical protein
MYTLTFAGAVAAALLASVASVSAQCTSFGVDISNGGTFFFNPASGAPMSFKGGFTGCITETVTPTMTLPSGNSINCSPITTDMQDYESVCQIDHAHMVAGAYTIFLVANNNGVEFGRGFNVVQSQVTIASTVTPVSDARHPSDS